MTIQEHTLEFLPRGRSLAALKKAAASCQGCLLYQRATQTVFGEGAGHARLVMIGEQPGDQEDLAGRPFIGPAGRLLDAVLREVNIDRSRVYVTNAVKHFKWTERGKRRLHAKPSSRQVTACRPWLEAELQAIEPRVIVCLGATAAQSLLGASFRLTQNRGRFMESDWARWIVATYHPSALLRAPDAKSRRAMRADFVHDLSEVARKLQTEE